MSQRGIRYMYVPSIYNLVPQSMVLNFINPNQLSAKDALIENNNLLQTDISVNQYNILNAVRLLCQKAAAPYLYIHCKSGTERIWIPVVFVITTDITWLLILKKSPTDIKQLLIEGNIWYWLWIWKKWLLIHRNACCTLFC